MKYANSKYCNNPPVEMEEPSRFQSHESLSMLQQQLQNAALQNCQQQSCPGAQNVYPDYVAFKRYAAQANGAYLGAANTGYGLFLGNSLIGGLLR